MQIERGRPRRHRRNAGEEIDNRRDQEYGVPHAGQIRPEGGRVHQRLRQREFKAASVEDVVMEQDIQRSGGVLKALDHPRQHILRREHFRLNPRVHYRAPAAGSVAVQQDGGINIFRDVELIGRQFSIEGNVGAHGVLQRFPRCRVTNIPRMTRDFGVNAPDVAAQRRLHHRFPSVNGGGATAERGVSPVAAP